MTDLYSELGGGPAPETRREEGRLPPPPPSWTGPVQLPWSRRQPLPGLSLIPESPTRSSRTIPGPLPLSTTQPHFRLSRPLIAIAPGLGARGKRKKKKKSGGRALASLYPLLACRDTLRSGGASSCGERQVRLGRTPSPLPSALSADFLLRDPAACRDTASVPAGPWPRARARLWLGRAGTLSLSSRVRTPAWQGAGPGCEVPALRVCLGLEPWARSGPRRGLSAVGAGPLLQPCLPRELHLGALLQCTRKLQLVGVLIGGSLFGRDGSCGGKVPKTRGCSSRCELEPKLKFPPSPHSSSSEVS